MHCWVIGRGGMLGSGVEKRLPLAANVYEPKLRFSWNEPDSFAQEIEQEVHDFGKAVAGGPWSIYWCAGVGTVAASEEVLQSEIENIKRFLTAVKNSPGLISNQGSLFYSSSAGGIYAGVTSLPITEQTEAAPRSAYGLQKLKNEEMFGTFGREQGVRVLLGRIANLYGPAQNRSKGQGLVTAICQSYIRRKPAQIFVGLDTVRNYIYVDDAVKSIVRAMGIVADMPNGSVETKIIASNQNLTISAVLKECQMAFGSAPSVVLSRSRDLAAYPPDLRMKSMNFREADNFEPTPFVVGAHRVYQNLLKSNQSGQLAEARN
jgi:UDP-glucose 4-epimerase